MEIYIAVFLIEMLLGFIILGIHPQNASNRKKIIYLALTTAILGTLCGLRSSLVGYDTESYYISFERTSDTISGILSNEQHIETGFAALCTLVKVLGGNFTHLLLFCSFFIIGSFAIFVYRHSQNVLLSIFILMCFPYYYSSFDIIRHFMATSFLLLGYKYILNGKFVKYALLIIVGSVFQNTGLIYLLLYPLLRAKWSSKLFLSIGAGTLIIMLFATSIAGFVVEKTGRFSLIAEEWVGQFAGGELTALMYFILFVLACLARNNIKYKSRECNMSIISVLLLFAFSLIFIESRIATRYIMTFSGLLTVAMPCLLDKEAATSKSLNSTLLLSFVVIGLLYHAFMLYTNWQNVVPYIPVMVYPYL